MGTRIRAAVFVTLIITAMAVIAVDSAKLIGDEKWRDYVAQAQKLFDDAKATFERLRNVTISDTVTLHVITKQQAKDWWGHPSGEQDLANLYRQEKIYKGLFMMPEGDTLVEAASEWTANWVAATVGNNDIYIIRENFNPFHPDAEAVFIHEWTHIWQPDLTEPTTYNEDKAHAALVEGDSRFMEAYYKNITEADESYFRAAAATPSWILSNPLLDEVHPMSNTLWSINFFPYDKGEIFVNALHDQGGFATMNQAYDEGRTPSSTAQILHPERYFANITARQVGAPTLAEESWGLIQTDRGKDHNTYGEFFIQAMLDAWLDEEPAKNAAAGWAGDSFTYYEKNNDYLYTWNIQWTNRGEAREFFNAFQDMMNQTAVSAEGSNIWLSNGHYLMIDGNPNSDFTLIAVSNVQAAAQASYFS